MIDVYDIALIIGDILTVYTVKRLFSTFFESSKSKKLTNSAYFFYWVAISISSAFFDIPLVNSIVTIVCLLLAAFTYNATVQKRILISTFFYVLGVAVEIIVYAFSAATSDGGGPLVQGQYSNILGMFICKMIIFLIVLVIDKTKTNNGNVILPIPIFISSVFVPISATFIGAAIINIDGVDAVTVGISVSLLMVMNIVIFMLYDELSYYYERQVENAILSNEVAFYNNQIAIMKQSVDETRRFRHDIHNHFLAILGYIKDQNIKSAESYVSELADKNQEIQAHYVDTGNTVIDSLLNYKLAPLAERKISTDISALVPKDLTVDAYYFVVILTNLIDNAIEALDRCELNDEKILKIKINYNKGMLSIFIENSYNGKIDMLKGCYTTTKSDSKDHGFGIENVRNAVEKYNGSVLFENNKNIFSVKVLLYVE